MGSVKDGRTAVRNPLTPIATGREGRFPLEVRSHPHLTQELTMADVAFVLATIALFALVALVAKGVTKL
ncbi:hypothetical protein [Streptomyces canus]|uniref:hypothetical protein n=1 Tax=Streptomyces canus TaxID=58343 RepID=UPI0038224039